MGTIKDDASPCLTAATHDGDTELREALQHIKVDMQALLPQLSKDSVQAGMDTVAKIEQTRKQLQLMARGTKNTEAVQTWKLSLKRIASMARSYNKESNPSLSASAASLATRNATIDLPVSRGAVTISEQQHNLGQAFNVHLVNNESGMHGADMASFCCTDQTKSLAAELFATDYDTQQKDWVTKHMLEHDLSTAMSPIMKPAADVLIEKRRFATFPPEALCRPRFVGEEQSWGKVLFETA